MKPHTSPLTPPAEALQAAFRAQFEALDGFDRMTRRWASLTALPDLYGPSLATKSVLASVDFGQPVPQSTVRRDLAPVAQAAALQSVDGT